jgi:hypothetical protein
MRVQLSTLGISAHAMKTLTIIRFVSAAVVVTLACVGLFEGVIGIAVLFSLAWLLLMGRSELTKPIPRNEWWLSVIAIIGLLALILTFRFLHLPEPHGVARLAVSVVLWVLWIWAICRRWQRERTS